MQQGPTDEQEKRGFAIRIGLFFGALFVVLGAQVPYLPVWLDWRGLTPAEIGIVSATPLILRLVATPTVAFLADRGGHHRAYVIMLSWIGLAALLLLSWSQGFALILVVATFAALCLSTLMPLTETLAMSGVRRAGLDYGRMRLWGSLTFIATSFIGGHLVDRLGPAAGLWLVIAGAVMTVVAAHLLPRSGVDRSEASEKSAARIDLRDVRQLVTAPVMIAFLFAAGGVQSAHAVFYTFGAVHWRAQGISTTWVGALWSIGVIVEIVLFMVSGRLVARVGAVRLLTIGAVAAVVRWLAMAFDPALPMLIPLQVLHGLTYGAAHIGAMHVLARVVPERQAGTAQALYATVTAGIGIGGAMLLAGPLYAIWGGKTYLLMVVLAAVGLVGTLVLARLTPDAVVSPTGADRPAR